MRHIVEINNLLELPELSLSLNARAQPCLKVSRIKKIGVRSASARTKSFPSKSVHHSCCDSGGALKRTDVDASPSLFGHEVYRLVQVVEFWTSAHILVEEDYVFFRDFFN